jgi:sodium transport system permease protein
VLSSLFFAVTHSLLQQSVISFLVGLVIAFIAVQTGSIFPCMLFHFTHNGSEFLSAYASDNPHFRQLLLWLPNGEYIYSWWLFGLGSLVAVWLLIKFARLTYQKTEEETLQDAIDHQVAEANA